MLLYQKVSVAIFMVDTSKDMSCVYDTEH